ncbi:hypothetical protein diail_8649 [Diaporthe ilicicola]|nr:hypothetical protein diail_8649 [Diaporthe ilicicola]
MALHSQWSSKEVIDLTGVDDDEDVQQVQPPRPGSPPAVANGFANGFANDAPPGGSSFYAQPRPAPSQSSHRPLAASVPSYAPSPPAKRQKLSQPPHGTSYEEQLITISVGQHLSPYARDAAEALARRDLDKDKLRSEIQIELANYFGAAIRQNGRLPNGLVGAVKARAKSFAQQFAALPPPKVTRYLELLTLSICNPPPFGHPLPLLLDNFLMDYPL